MARPIGASYDFNVGGSNPRALVKVVLDAGVRNLDLVVNVGQTEFVGDLLFDLVEIAVRIGLALSVECPLHVALNFKVEDHARVRPAKTLNSLHFFEISTIDLSVMLHLSGLYEARVKLLILSETSDLLHDLLAGTRQRDDLNPLRFSPRTIAAGIDRTERHNAFLFQISKISVQRAAVAAVDGFR